MFYVFFKRTDDAPILKMVTWFMTEREAKAMCELRNNRKIGGKFGITYYTTETDANAKELIHIENFKKWNR